MPMTTSTNTDPGLVAWILDDEVIRLREWASDRLHPMPATGAAASTAFGDWFIGSAEDCIIRLEDPLHRVSRHHARIIRERTRWSLLDLCSKNGLLADGTRHTTAMLEPGLEIGIGGITLVAESSRLIALRSFLLRILGWADERAEAVDLALRAIRMAQARRAPLVLRGEGDLVPIAQDLHRRVLGPLRPFILCDPRRQSVKANVRSSANFDRGMEALGDARGGSLCVRSNRPPADLLKVIDALRDPSAHVQLIVCDVCESSRRDTEAMLGVPITIPPLNSRRHELPHIVNEYTFDAAASLGVPAKIYREDRAWILEHCASSLHEIETGTRRLMALRATGTVLGAAELLGMASVSLRRWIGRRAVPALHRHQEPTGDDRDDNP